jgi:hypothetical protein
MADVDISGSWQIKFRVVFGEEEGIINSSNWYRFDAGAQQVSFSKLQSTIGKCQYASSLSKMAHPALLH